MCMNSLKLGKSFKDKNKIKNTTFIQMNLFNPAFKSETFDIVICNGVLHHTNNPFLGFKSIADLVKKNGYIIIGLYNSYGRKTTDIRRFIFNATGNRFLFLDPRLRSGGISSLRKNIWYMDQYKNPHESVHSMDEVLDWFSKTGFEFVNSIPKIIEDKEEIAGEQLFSNNLKGTKIDRVLTQLGLLISGGKEGGFFIMIGCKK
jgi:SAM-dependent methyltransferase